MASTYSTSTGGLWLAAICAYMMATFSIAIFIMLANSQERGPQAEAEQTRRLGSRTSGGTAVDLPATGGRDAMAAARMRFGGLAEAILARQEGEGRDALELSGEYFHVFDDVSCQGPFPSIDQAREELKRSMRAPPSKVIDEVVRLGVGENQTKSKTFRDVLTNTPVLGSDSFYLAAAHAAFEPKAATYSVCVAVTALQFQTTMALSQYIEAPQEEIDGDEACRCGMFFCSRCFALRRGMSMLPEFNPDVIYLQRQQQQQQKEQQEQEQELQQELQQEQEQQQQPQQQQQKKKQQQHDLGSWLESRVAKLILSSLSSSFIV